MRTSEALLLGSTLIWPLKGLFFDGNESGCALGMIVAGQFGMEGLNGVRGWALPSWLTTPRFTPLPCKCKDYELMGSCGVQQPRDLVEISPQTALVHLFNYHYCTTRDWSIEQIADWLRTIEPNESEEIPEIPAPLTTEKRFALAEVA